MPALSLVFGFVMAYVWFKVSDLITPIRVSKDVEIEGLDVAEVGIPGYNDMPEAEKSWVTARRRCKRARSACCT